MLFCRVPTNVLKLMTQCKWGTSWFMDSCKGKLLNLLGLTDLFEKLYLRLSGHPLYPSPSQIKSYYVFGTKTLLRRYTEIYIHLLSKWFKNAVGVKKWCCTIFFFWHQTETCFLENLYNQKGFWLSAGVYCF